MKFLSVSLAASLLSVVSAQTFTNCDPVKQDNCPPDPALGGHNKFDFTSKPDRFDTSGGEVKYSSDGAALSVAKQGDNPTLISHFFIMFGHVEWVLKAAPGQGIVSSVTLQSDARDEIDWEFLGGKAGTVQSNYFRQGDTSSYDREATHNVDGQSGFHTYAIDWTNERIEWSIDGKVVRTQTVGASKGQYPQTPMMVRTGIWAGGDPSNGQGTIDWAGGPTNYDGAPYTMQVKSIDVTDYSTGTSYKYAAKDGHQKGEWQAIESEGGEIKTNGTPGSGPEVKPSTPPTSETTDSPSPSSSEGTHPSGYPWEPKESTPGSESGTQVTSKSGLPSGSVVTDSEAQPPSTASVRDVPILLLFVGLVSGFLFRWWL